jgi:hypothetical protein
MDEGDAWFLASVPGKFLALLIKSGWPKVEIRHVTASA